MPVLHWDNTHQDYYFSQDVSKAIGQCHRYLDVLHAEALRGLRDHPEIVAYHPRAIIVIGRSWDWSDELQLALHGLNCRLNAISVMTYDHLLAQCENTLQLLGIATLQEDQEDGLTKLRIEYESEPPNLTDSDELTESEQEEELSEEEAADGYRVMHPEAIERRHTSVMGGGEFFAG
jgi:hypothetical protein